MATAAKNGNKTAGNSTARLSAQREYVSGLQAKWAADPKNKNKGTGCFVVPVFSEDGKSTGVVTRTSDKMTPGQSLIMIMSVGEMAYSFDSKSYRQEVKTAVIFAPTAFLSTLYKAGANIGGRIATKYSVGTGRKSDQMFSIQYPTIPLADENDQPIYKHQAWTPDLDMTDDTMPALGQSCLDAIQDARAEALSAAGKPA